MISLIHFAPPKDTLTSAILHWVTLYQKALECILSALESDFVNCHVSRIPLIATHQRIFQPREVIEIVVQIGRIRYYLLAISDREASFVLEYLYNKMKRDCCPVDCRSVSLSWPLKHQLLETKTKLDVP